MFSHYFCQLGLDELITNAPHHQRSLQMYLPIVLTLANNFFQYAGLDIGGGLDLALPLAGQAYSTNLHVEPDSCSSLLRVSPGWPQNGPRWFKMSRDDPKMSRDRAKMGPREAKLRPR